MGHYYLGIHTLGSLISMSIQKDDMLLSSIQLDQSKKNLEGLSDLIKIQLDQSDLSFQDISAIAVANGPGAYTGIRCGVVVAKTIAQIHQIPIYPINALELLAKPYQHISEVFWVLSNSLRDQCHIACFGGTSSGLKRLTDDMSIPVSKIIHMLNRIEAPTHIFCDLKKETLTQLTQDIKKDHQINTIHLNPFELSNLARKHHLNENPGQLSDCQASYSHPVT